MRTAASRSSREHRNSGCDSVTGSRSVRPQRPDAKAELCSSESGQTGCGSAVPPASSILLDGQCEHLQQLDGLVTESLCEALPPWNGSGGGRRRRSQAHSQCRSRCRASSRLFVLGCKKGVSAGTALVCWGILMMLVPRWGGGGGGGYRGADAATVRIGEFPPVVISNKSTGRKTCVSSSMGFLFSCLLQVRVLV